MESELSQVKQVSTLYESIMYMWDSRGAQSSVYEVNPLHSSQEIATGFTF